MLAGWVQPPGTRRLGWRRVQGVREAHLREYSHWAFGDLDVIMGDAAAWIDPFEMRAFDVFTFSFGDQFRA